MSGPNELIFVRDQLEALKPAVQAELDKLRKALAESEDLANIRKQVGEGIHSLEGPEFPDEGHLPHNRFIQILKGKNFKDEEGGYLDQETMIHKALEALPSHAKTARNVLELILRDPQQMEVFLKYIKLHSSRITKEQDALIRFLVSKSAKRIKDMGNSPEQMRVHVEEESSARVEGLSIFLPKHSELSLLDILRPNPVGSGSEWTYNENKLAAALCDFFIASKLRGCPVEQPEQLYECIRRSAALRHLKQQEDAIRARTKAKLRIEVFDLDRFPQIKAHAFAALIPIVRKYKELGKDIPEDLVLAFDPNQIDVRRILSFIDAVDRKPDLLERLFGRDRGQADEMLSREAPDAVHELVKAYEAASILAQMGLYFIDLPQLAEKGIQYLAIAKAFSKKITEQAHFIELQLKLAGLDLSEFENLIQAIGYVVEHAAEKEVQTILHDISMRAEAAIEVRNLE